MWAALLALLPNAPSGLLDLLRLLVVVARIALVTAFVLAVVGLLGALGVEGAGHLSSLAHPVAKYEGILASPLGAVFYAVNSWGVTSVLIMSGLTTLTLVSYSLMNRFLRSVA